MLSALIQLLCFLLLSGCSSTPTDAPSGVPNPPVASVDPGSPVLTPVENDVSQVAAERPNEAAMRLASLLQSLGYESLGMQFEDEATLNLLTQVFSDVRTHDRDLKLVYTGLKMDFDKIHRSLTIGGLQDVGAIVSYIVKNVPSKIVPTPVATPATTPQAIKLDKAKKSTKKNVVAPTAGKKTKGKRGGPIVKSKPTPRAVPAPKASTPAAPPENTPAKVPNIPPIQEVTSPPQEIPSQPNMDSGADVTSPPAEPAGETDLRPAVDSPSPESPENSTAPPEVEVQPTPEPESVPSP